MARKCGRSDILSAAMEVTVRPMVAYSHPCDRSYTADATFEHL